MADINNFSQITENFDTIKTLLNSIRAQGILNTSDVDKLLSGINSKLEKLNTGEDIDLIKIFLSELKQNLDERHNVLISKFGAIESLFSNLLKNSADSLKSNEVKELFDIVATNLSVFSREVVSQKETLTDIILRLDSMRSDDSLKKDISKNISILKNDLEHLNNGFDSIVLSLNENFKTLIKTLSEVDQSDAIGKFGKELSDIIVSSNSILSAIQLLDKKNIQLEDSIKSLSTHDDLVSTKKWISDLAVQQDNLKNSIDALSDKFYKVDNLAEKIDASVNIIAGLKSLISENSDDNSQLILSGLEKLESSIKDDITNLDLETFKNLVKEALNKLIEGSMNQGASLDNVFVEISKIDSSIKLLGSSVNMQEVISLLNDLKNIVIEQLSLSSDKVVQNIDSGVNKTISEIVSNTKFLEEKFKDISSEFSNLCVSNFSEIMDSVKVLKTILAQLDENYVSGNNAIFSNITDRLAVFENSLKISLDKQEDYVSNSATKLIEQLSEVKNLSGVLDYKLDASVIELNNAKREFTELKSAVNDVLGLDFVNVVKDLRVDLYAVKQDLSNVIDTSSVEISDKILNDLFSKYQLLVSKLDSLEDSFKNVQKNSLIELKQLLDGLSSSLVDILSYVSSQKDFDQDSIDNKLAIIIESVKDNNLNYIEDVRGIVEVIRTQVENNLVQIQKDTIKKVEEINTSILKTEDNIKQEIKYSYNKLLEIQDKFTGLEKSLSVNNEQLVTDITDILNNSNEFRVDFENKLLGLKNLFVDKIIEFKNEISCENTDKISEVKFVTENLHLKALQNNEALNTELKGEVTQLIGNLRLNIEELAEQVVATNVKFDVGNKDLVNFIKESFAENINLFVESLTSKINDFSENVNILSTEIKEDNSNLSNNLKVSLDNVETKVCDIKNEIIKSAKNLDLVLDKNNDNLIKNVLDVKSDVADLKADLNKDSGGIKDSVSLIGSNLNDMSLDVNLKYSQVLDKFSEVASSVNLLSENTTKSFSSVLSQVLDNFVALKAILSSIDDKSSQNIDKLYSDVLQEFRQLAQIVTNMDSNIDEDITRQIAIIDDKFELLENRLNTSFENVNNLLSNTIKTELSIVNKELKESLVLNLENYVNKFDNLFNNLLEKNNTQSEIINSSVSSLAALLEDVLKKQNLEIEERIANVSKDFKLILNENFEISSKEYEDLKIQLSALFKGIEQSNINMMTDLKAQFDDIVKFIDSGLEIQAQNIETQIDDLNENANKISGSVLALNNFTKEKYDELLSSISLVKKDVLDNLKLTNESFGDMDNSLSEKFNNDLNNLYNKLTEIINEHSLKIENSNIELALNANKDFVVAVNELENKCKDFIEKIETGVKADSIELKNSLDSTYNLLDEIRNSFEKDIVNQSETIKTSINNLITTITHSWSEVEQSLDEKVNNLMVTYTDLSAGELQSLEAFVDKIMQQLLNVKENSSACANLVKDFVKQEIKSTVSEIEKESDLIITDMMEQFNLFKDIQKDELSKLTLHLESSIEDYVYNHINDLKAYLDIKTDNSMLNHKLDGLKNELDTSVDVVVDNINKLLETSVFEAKIADLKKTNQVLISSMSETLNSKIEKFILENIKKDIDDKFTFFDKKFIDAIVENYEEIKLIATTYNTSFNDLKNVIVDFVEHFNKIKDDLNNNITGVIKDIFSSIEGLNKSFSDLKAQIMNKSFDEAFQASLNSQIDGIEDLINRQFGYLEDISSLCCDNLPELTEMNAIVKHGIMESLNTFIAHFDENAESIDNQLKTFKTDIITQFINVFNQISFVAEQEEIVDFIQEKHSELITILSHIVTNLDTVEDVKDSIVVVDSKIEDIKEDINLINEKITSIMSSSGDIDYVYSLQDLESDIANLRLILDDVKKSHTSEELNDLLKSTNDIYKLVESLKDSFPKFEYEDFKQDFEALTEDIVSISTRTNKLILASDESYKTLQDNLQDFKLVINDLDERTRNFAQEAGIDKIDNKLHIMNTMMQNGVKTNQVFNQVFEYLAEWVDKAGEKINTISDKVETLDDIGQIRLMLEDLKVNAENDSESAELIEALSNIFDKQVKKISSLEAKLDRVIVETTINNKENKIDLSPMEETLNRFLVAIDQKMSSQQDKISKLESQLEEVLSFVDSKDTAQLTKKVGGMDRQIAKLNKSIEKIASHVVEK